MKIHLSNIYYYFNKNIYLSHILSKKIIKRLKNILNTNNLYIVNENKIIKKLYKIFKKNINNYSSTLLNNELIVNRIVIQLAEHLKSNMFNFHDKDYSFIPLRVIRNNQLDNEIIKEVKSYFEKNKKLQISNITYFTSYFLDFNIQILLNKLEIDVFLNEICNKQTNNI
jgi:hypothetical protein